MRPNAEEYQRLSQHNHSSDWHTLTHTVEPRSKYALITGLPGIIGLVTLTQQDVATNRLNLN